MKLLLLILSLMSWFVTSWNTVLGDGDIPDNIAVSYHNTSHLKGQVGAGDTATVSFSKLAGMTIERIVVYTKSNKTAGAGEFSVLINGGKTATKSGTFAQWTGGYDNTAYHAITILSQSIENVETLAVQLVGTTSSLHIDHYEITYSPAQPHTVTLMNANEVYASITELSGGAGFYLPCLEDIEEWTFTGWSETEFWATEEEPQIWLADTKYYPSSDCSIWAVYAYDESQETTYVTDLVSGTYIYVHSESQLAMRGVPVNGEMASALVSPDDERQYYQIVFSGADTAYITHAKTGTPIGYTSDAKLSDTASPWLVYHDGEETLFYTTIKKKNYVLWTEIRDGYDENLHTGLYAANPMTSPMRLQVPAQKSDPVYTCHPECGMGVDNIMTEGRNDLEKEYIILFGNYQLIIRNGKKYLQLW